MLSGDGIGDSKMKWDISFLCEKFKATLCLKERPVLLTGGNWLQKVKKQKKGVSWRRKFTRQEVSVRNKTRL